MPIAAKQVEIRIDVVVRRDGVEDEVKTESMPGHFVGVGSDDNYTPATTQRVFFLIGRGCEENGVGAESVGEFHSHVAQPTKPNDADFLPLGDTPMMHG